MAAVADLAAPAGRPLAVLHLGGGALTLPRYLAATRPGSIQTVIERDPAVVDLVARELPPTPAGIEVRVADAREAVVAALAEAYDLVFADIYRAARMPPHVTTMAFAAEVARVLRPDGIYLVNVTDLPPLVLTRVQAATLRAVFAEVCRRRPTDAAWPAVRQRGARGGAAPRPATPGASGGTGTA